MPTIRDIMNWVGDQMYGVWLLFRPYSGSEEDRPDGTQPDKASPPAPGADQSPE